MGNVSRRVFEEQAPAPAVFAPQLAEKLQAAGFAVSLRPYQARVTLQVSEALKQSLRPLVVLPTGAGKTISAASWIALSFARPEATGQQCLFVSHRTILSENAASTVEAVTPLRVGIVGGGSSDWEADVVCVTIQSLQSDDAWRRIADMRLRTVIVDEAHRVSTASYNRFFSRLQELHPDARIIGLTATPIRADGKKLHPFDQVIEGPSLQDLIDLGVLVTPRFFVPVLDGHPSISWFGMLPILVIPIAPLLFGLFLMWEAAKPVVHYLSNYAF